MLRFEPWLSFCCFVTEFYFPSYNFLYKSLELCINKLLTSKYQSLRMNVGKLPSSWVNLSPRRPATITFNICWPRIRWRSLEKKGAGILLDHHQICRLESFSWTLFPLSRSPIGLTHVKTNCRLRATKITHTLTNNKENNPSSQQIKLYK